MFTRLSSSSRERSPAPASCPACSAASDRIKELETQVKLLEDKLRALQPPALSTPPPSAPSTSRPTSAEPSAPSLNRISAFLSTSLRRTAPPSPPPDRDSCHERPHTSSGGPPSASAALVKEQKRREEAEKRVAEITAELEDLSASLFEQANTMVAEERREKARLEERVGVLEGREKGRRERLGVLERAVERVIAVRRWGEGE